MTTLQKSPSFKNESSQDHLDLPEASLLGHKRSYSDSAVKVPDNVITAKPWSCDLCQYENVDPTASRCALCGTQKQKQAKVISMEPLPPLGVKRKFTDKGESPLASSKSTSQSSVPPTDVSDDKTTPTPEPKAEPKAKPIEVEHEEIGSTCSRDALESHSSDHDESSEDPDVVLPLTKVRETTTTTSGTSINILDLTNMVETDDQSQDFGQSEATLQVSNVQQGLRGKGHSEVTIPTSNVHKEEAEDTVDSTAIEQTNQEVSLDELYKVGAVPARLTDDITKQQMSANNSKNTKAKSQWVPPAVPIEDKNEPGMVDVDLEAGDKSLSNTPSPDKRTSDSRPMQEKPKFATKICIFRGLFVVGVLVAIVLSATLIGRDTNESEDNNLVDPPPSSLVPSSAPTSVPTSAPSSIPSDFPSTFPSSMPSPSFEPTLSR